jgi:DNA-binding NtrC family response regulator
MKEGKQFTILVVDDEELIRETIAADFHRKGFKVLTAENGNRAFEFIITQPIDLVISDVQMPECDGPALLKKTQETKPSLPFIFMSGGSTITEAECLRMGARKFLMKPFDFKALQSSALKILGL